MCQQCLKQLGVKSKLKIYNLIKKAYEGGNCCSVGDIVQKMDLTQPTVSYHLSQMEKVGLLTKQKIGKQVFYQVNQICVRGNVLCPIAKGDLNVGD